MEKGRQGTQTYFFPTSHIRKLTRMFLEVYSLQFYLVSGKKVCIFNVIIPGTLKGKDSQNFLTPLLILLEIECLLSIQNEVSVLRNFYSCIIIQLIKKLNVLKIKLNNNDILRVNFQVYFCGDDIHCLPNTDFNSGHLDLGMGSALHMHLGGTQVPSLTG